MGVLLPAVGVLLPAVGVFPPMAEAAEPAEPYGRCGRSRDLHRMRSPIPAMSPMQTTCLSRRAGYLGWLRLGHPYLVWRVYSSFFSLCRRYSPCECVRSVHACGVGAVVRASPFVVLVNSRKAVQSHLRETSQTGRTHNVKCAFSSGRSDPTGHGPLLVPCSRFVDLSRWEAVQRHAPTAPDERLPRICARSRGFVYGVGLARITGVRETLVASAKVMAGRLKAVTDQPMLVGVGVGTPEQAVDVSAVGDGVVVGSALVGSKRALGSTAVHDAVATQDTVTMLYRLTRRLTPQNPTPNTQKPPTHQNPKNSSHLEH